MPVSDLLYIPETSFLLYIRLSRNYLIILTERFKKASSDAPFSIPF